MSSKRLALLSVTALLFLLFLLFSSAAAAQAPGRPGYARDRKAFKTEVRDTPRQHTPAPKPPAGVYELVRYPAPLGKNAAYVTPIRKDGRKRPAILWLQGGFEWGIDDSAWKPAPRENDQSARAFREAGMVQMMPSLRGCNDNPGSREYFLGEVDDVLAALEFLRSRPDVDPERVYLGGHSTGATMALLVAASRPQSLRAVFAFGPVASVGSYGETGTALDRATPVELAIRSPAMSLSQAIVPVFVIEGEKGNVRQFEPLRMAARHADVSFFAVRGASHFSTLAPITSLIAARIVREAEGGKRFELSEEDLAVAVAVSER